MARWGREDRAPAVRRAQPAEAARRAGLAGRMGRAEFREPGNGRRIGNRRTWGFGRRERKRRRRRERHRWRRRRGIGHGRQGQRWERSSRRGRGQQRDVRLGWSRRSGWLGRARLRGAAHGHLLRRRHDRRDVHVDSSGMTGCRSARKTSSASNTRRRRLPDEDVAVREQHLEHADPFCVSESAGTVTITTSRIKVMVDETTGVVTYHRPERRRPSSRRPARASRPRRSRASARTPSRPRSTRRPAKRSSVSASTRTA